MNEDADSDDEESDEIDPDFDPDDDVTMRDCCHEAPARRAE